MPHRERWSYLSVEARCCRYAGSVTAATDGHYMKVHLNEAALKRAGLTRVEVLRQMQVARAPQRSIISRSRLVEAKTATPEQQIADVVARHPAMFAIRRRRR